MGERCVCTALTQSAGHTSKERAPGIELSARCCSTLQDLFYCFRKLSGLKRICDKRSVDIQCGHSTRHYAVT